MAKGLNKRQAIVADHFLTVYPRTDWEALLKLVRKGSNRVLIWRLFECCEGSEVAEYMEGMLERINNDFPSRRNKPGSN